VFEEFLNKRVIVFFDDGGTVDNVKRKQGTVTELSDNMIMIVEDQTSVKMIFPRERIIRVELTGR
jgi:hypothetical protein